MVAFTPAIAFTQNAKADATTATLTSNSTTAEVATAFGVAQSAVSGAGTSSVTVTLPSATTLKDDITLGNGLTVKVNMAGYTLTHGTDSVDSFTLNAGATLDLESTTAATFTAGTTSAVTAKGTSANITIGKNVAVTGDVVIGATTTGTTTIDGTVTGVAGDFKTMALKGTGNTATTGGTPGIDAQSATTTGTAAVATGCTGVTPAVVSGLTYGATAAGTANNATKAFSYQWYKAQKVASGTDNNTYANAVANGALTKIDGATSERYEATKATTETYLYCVVTDGTLFGTTVNTAGATVAAADKAPTLTTLAGVPSNDSMTAYVGTAATQNVLTATVSADATSVDWYTNSTKSVTGATKITNATKFGGKYMTVGDYDTAANTSKLTIPAGTATASEVGTQYIFAVAKNAAGDSMLTTSKYFELNVEASGLAIKTQPTDVSLAIGDTAAATPAADACDTTFAVSGVTTANTYAVLYNTTESNVGGTATMPTGITVTKSAGTGNTLYLSFGANATAKAGTYYFYVTDTNANTSATKSNVFKVTVAAPGVKTSPKSATYKVGTDAAQISAAMVGKTAPTYQWYVSTKAYDATPAATVAAVAAGIVTGTTFAITADNASKYITEKTADTAKVTPVTTTEGTLYYFCAMTSGTTYYTDAAKIEVTNTVYPAKGVKFTSGSAKYKISKAATASAAGSVRVYAPAKSSTKGVSIPASVSYSTSKYTKATYNITGIYSKAFAKSKATTVKVKSTKLTKSTVKNCFKGSKVKTVKVPKAKYKAYKKIFTKKNCGKTVKVKKY